MKAFLSSDPDSAATCAELLPTRYSLLSRLQDWEDQESWRNFFDSYWRLIYSVALKSGLTPGEAEDVVQETIVCVAKNIGKFKRDRQKGSFKGWLCNLTRWRIADQLRKRTGLMQGEGAGSPRYYERLENLPELADPSACEDWESEWQSNLLSAALQKIKLKVKEEQYQLFDLYALKQWPVDRISRTLGVSTTTIYLAKHRISRLLRKEIARLEREWNCDPGGRT